MVKCVIQQLAYDHVCTLDTVTGNLADNSVFITVRSMRDIRTSSNFFSFFETLFINVASSRLNKREEAWSLMWNAIRY